MRICKTTYECYPCKVEGKDAEVMIEAHGDIERVWCPYCNDAMEWKCDEMVER